MKKIYQDVIFYFFVIVAFVTIIFFGNFISLKIPEAYRDYLRFFSLLVAYVFAVYCFFVDNEEDIKFVKVKPEKIGGYKRIFPCWDLPSPNFSESDDFQQKKKRKR